MHYYSFAELYANIAQKNKSVGVSVHLQIEKALICLPSLNVSIY